LTWRRQGSEEVAGCPVEAGQFLWCTTPEASFLEPAGLREHPRLRCAFTRRQAGTSGGALNVSFSRGTQARVQANRQRVLRALGLGHTRLYTVRQVHGNQVCIVDEQAVQRGVHGVAADALVTTLPDVSLGVLVADCLPIVLYTCDPPVLAVVHAGRMGTYHRIVLRVMDMLRRHFAVRSERTHAVLGPAIGACCYTLDIQAIGPFQKRFPDWETFFTPRAEGQWVMDLTAANRIQLRAAGIPPQHVLAADICTSCCNQDFYSHRAEGREAGRGMGVAALLSASKTG
jgi:YfiH family protein